MKLIFTLLGLTALFTGCEKTQEPEVVPAPSIEVVPPPPPAEPASVPTPVPVPVPEPVPAPVEPASEASAPTE